MKKIISMAAMSASALLLACSYGPPADASSHREAPLISEDPCVDCTDVYAFVSPDAPTTVTLIANYIPLEEPSGGPNYFKFSDSALYEIHIDNDADANEDITFQWRFTTTTKSSTTFLYNTGVISYSGGDTYANLNVEQHYDLTMVKGDRRTGVATTLGTGLVVAPNNVGDKSIPPVPGYAPLEAGAIKTLTGGIKAFAGPRDDPFFVSLGRAFDLLNIDPVLPGGDESQGGTVLPGDYLKGFNCHTLALQVPITMLTANGLAPTGTADPVAVIGVWSTASRRQVILNRTGGRDPYVGGAWVQVSRLGAPLVNEVVIDRAHKDVWNNSHPRDDAQFLTFVQNSELAGIMVSLFGVSVPANPRTDLVTVFLTGVPGLNQSTVPSAVACEYLRLNMAQPLSVTPTRMGAIGAAAIVAPPVAAVAGQPDGYPNGRRLVDDVVDISLRAVAGGYFATPTFDVRPNNALGDTVIANDNGATAFLPSFPYVARPNDGVSRAH